MKITDSITIHAPIDRVFDVFTDLDQAAARVKAITKVELLEGPGHMDVGTKWRETRVLFGKEATEVMWVTELSKDKSYVVEADSHGTKYRSVYTFEQKEDAVEVTMAFEGIPYSTSARIMNFMSFLFKGATQKALHKDLLDLKQAAETA